MKKRGQRIICKILTAVIMFSTVMTVPLVETETIEAASAARYEYMTVSSGFNKDAIVTSGESYSGTESLDQALGVTGSRGAILYTSSYNPNSGYVPSNGIISDVTYSGLSWQLGSYTSNNVLKLGKGGSGTLTFTKTGCYQNVYILSIAGGVQGGSLTMNATVNYTDGSTKTATFTVVDWYTSTNYAYAGLRRIDSGSLSGSTSAGPYITRSVLSGVDTTKLIKSITFTNTASSSSMYLNIFAVTGQTANVGVPVVNAAKYVTTDSFTASWSSATNAATYRLDVATDANFTNMVSGYNNKVVTNTSCRVTGLKPATRYYYRVRAVNSSGGQSASSSYTSTYTYRNYYVVDGNGVGYDTLDSNGLLKTGSPGNGLAYLFIDRNGNWANEPLPSRTGYDFVGYYTKKIGGDKIFDSSQKGSASGKANTATKLSPELYAHWVIHTSTLTVDLNGGQFEDDSALSSEDGWAQNDKTYSITKKYGESVSIPIPKKEGKIFYRWLVTSDKPNGTLTNAAVRYDYQFGPLDNVNVKLTAVWNDAEFTSVIDNTANKGVTTENLSQIINYTATSDTAGLTEKDFASGNKVSAAIVVSDSTADASGAAQIRTKLNSLGVDAGSSVYYDIKATKTVDSVTTNLTELPMPVIISIPLSESMQKMDSLAVYRYHDNQVELLSSSTSSPEHYEVSEDKSKILIYTQKFSAYCVAESNSKIEGFTLEKEGSKSTDVQGKILDDNGTIVYKVDVTWGYMHFEFVKENSSWDPNTHSYQGYSTPQIELNLKEEDAYDGSNNKIVVTNHSNAQVKISAKASDTDFDTIQFAVKQGDDDNADEVNAVTIPAVYGEGASAVVSDISCYVRVVGSLSDTGYEEWNEQYGKSDEWHGVSVITLTVSPLGK